MQAHKERNLASSSGRKTTRKWWRWNKNPQLLATHSKPSQPK